MRRLALACFLLLSACSRGEVAPTPVPIGSADWRSVATGEDRERLREWRSAFTRGLERARAAGHGAAIAAEGALLDPDSGQPGPLPNGRYLCRIVKLGAKGPGLLDFVAYPAFACEARRQGAGQSFAKLTGSQRPVGLLFPGDGMRQVFLGTLVLGDEQRAMPYGRDPDRDVAGWVERIGPQRWRMVMPRPRFESLVDVIELVPVR